jgi:hypothetical protein
MDAMILETLQNIEKLLMVIANNTRDAVPYNQRSQPQTFFYPYGTLPTTSEAGAVSPTTDATS